MATQITVNYKNNDYILEYSRNTVKQIEQQGFVFDQIGDKPATMVPLLVYGAFMKHNRGIKRSLVDEIYDHLADRVRDGENSFLHTLLDMYAETVTTLTEDNEIDEGNAATWKVIKG